MMGAVELDPVRAKRQRIARLADAGQRLGYSLLGLALAVFVAGLFAGLNGAVVAVAAASLIVGSVVLAPAIVLGFAAKAAEREDRDAGR